jgi:hypothetical protein
VRNAGQRYCEKECGERQAHDALPRFHRPVATRGFCNPYPPGAYGPPPRAYGPPPGGQQQERLQTQEAWMAAIVDEVPRLCNHYPADETCHFRSDQETPEQ